jgi:probable HAF family extracellular repeat protein
MVLGFSLQAQAAEFVVIDGLVKNGQPFSEANGVSDDGRVVVGMSATDEGDIAAFRWSNGSALNLGALPSVGPNASGQGISGNGAVLVGRGRTVDENNTPINAGWQWTEATGMVDLGRPATYASDASFDGSVIVGKASSDNSNALRWSTTNGAEIIPPLSTADADGVTTAHAVSADGQTIVGSSDNVPFFWTETTGTQALENMTGQAYDVNSDGSVIVGSAQFDDVLEAFRWTAQSGMTRLGLLPGDTGYSRAKAISANGQFIVGTSSGGSINNLRAFIWDAQNGMQDLAALLENQYNLDLQGLTLTSANGISADGNIIVGRAVDSTDNPRAWLVDLQTLQPTLSVDVLAPQTQSVFYQNETVTFEGLASDLEEGDLSDNIEWRSDIDGLLGQGKSLSVQLSTGDHNISAEVMDQTGDFAYNNIEISVLEQPQLEISVSLRRVFFFFYYTTVSWTGGTDSVEVLKNGSVSRTGGTSGEFTEYGRGNTYQVCQVNSNFCSNSVTAQ